MTFPQPPEARDTSNGTPQLRQRKSGSVPTTIAEEDGQTVPVRPASRPRLHSAKRRRSSMMTDGSSSMDDRRASFRSSTESLLSPPRAASHDEHLHEEPSIWYSAPLLFAIVPAIGGVAFKKGSILLTDVALLALAAVYLNWCLVTPWIWYHSAQGIQVAKPPLEGEVTEEALQDDLDDGEDHQDGEAPNAGDYPDKADDAPPVEDPAKVNPAAAVPAKSATTREASAELAMHELAALALCVIGPLLGSYVLHLIRSSLSSLHGGQLVSNLHLTLFVLGAELRPVGHCMKLVQARTLHLQRIVRTDPYAGKAQTLNQGQDVLDDFNQRLTEMQDALAASAEQRNETQVATKAEPSATPDDVKRTQQALQTQIDALNRAVRRYEKRETARVVQNEERLQDIETRLKESLSLAAAAAQYSQKPGLIMGILEWVVAWFKWTLGFFTWPFIWVSDTAWDVLKKLGLARPIIRRKKPGKRPENVREGKERDRLSKKREDGSSRPSDAWLKSRR